MNRRPLFYFALAFCFGIFVQNILPSGRWFLLVAFLGFILLGVLSRKSERWLLVSVAVAVALSGAFRLAAENALSKNDISAYAAGDRGSLSLEGVIASPVDTKLFYGKPRASFLLEARRIQTKDMALPMRTRGLARVFLKDGGESLNYGDRLSLQGELATVKGATNPGGFDKKAYWDRLGVRAYFYAGKSTSVAVLERGAGNYFYAQALVFREFLSRKLAADFKPRDAAFLQALFFGERGGLEEDFKELFLKTGTMHILAVSGFNIGFLIAVLAFLLKPLRLPKNVFGVVTLFSIWCYCLLVGWQSPVVRASVMATVFILGRILGRRTDILNSLGFAALVILAIGPKQLYDVGFQLSFLAVWGLAVFAPVFIPKLELWPNETLSIREKSLRYVEELFWVSFICLFVTMPVTVQNFYIAAPLSILANLVVVPVSFLLFFIGVIYFLTFWWVPKSLVLIGLAVKLLMQLFVGSLYFVENLPGAYFIVGKLSPVFWMALVTGLFYLALTSRIKSRTARAVFIFFFSLNIFLAQAVYRKLTQKFSMTMLDVGQGDSFYFEFPGSGNMLIDTGKGGDSDKGRWVVAPFLKSKGVGAISAFVLTHSHDDHIGGAATVLDEFKVGTVVTSGRFMATGLGRALERKIQDKRVKRAIAGRGNRIEGFPETQMEVLGPEKELMDDRKPNLESLVLKITYHGVTFLMAGDVQDRAIRSILESGAEVKADVLKVPHHGLNLGTDWPYFLEKIHPAVSLLSDGTTYHAAGPSEKTLESLRSIPGNRIYRTDKDGAINLSIGRSGTIVATAYSSLT